MVDLGRVNGLRVRKTFPTKAGSETFTEHARLARENEGVTALSLSQEIWAAAAKCLERLAPHNATLTEAKAVQAR